MNAFFRYFTERHLLANLFTLVMILLGVVTLFRIQRDTYPTVDFGEMMIQTTYPGASPEDVELKVTNKIVTAQEGKFWKTQWHVTNGWYQTYEVVENFIK